ncbi:MAG: pilin [Candidatus Falkowbacteria bacterium]
MKGKKILLSLLFFSILSLNARAASAAWFNPFSTDLTTGMQRLTNDVTNQAYSPATNETSIFEIVGGIIRVFLGLLGTIFVILLILAGYNWLTAAGKKEKVEKAQSTIRTAIIGLVIIAAAYAITYWVFARMPDSNTQSASPTSADFVGPPAP